MSLNVALKGEVLRKKNQREGLIAEVLLFCPVSAFFIGITDSRLLFVQV